MYDTVRETRGYAKQGAGYGYTGVKGLNALIATVCTIMADSAATAGRRCASVKATTLGAVSVMPVNGA